MEGLLIATVEEAVAILRRAKLPEDQIVSTMVVLKVLPLSQRYKQAVREYGVNLTEEQLMTVYADLLTGAEPMPTITQADVDQVTAEIASFAPPVNAKVIAMELQAMVTKGQLETEIPTAEVVKDITDKQIDDAIDKHLDGLFEHIPIKKVPDKVNKAYIANQCCDELVMRAHFGPGGVHARYAEELAKGEYTIAPLAFNLMPADTVYTSPFDDVERPGYPITKANYDYRVYVDQPGVLRLLRKHHKLFACPLTCDDLVQRYGQYGKKCGDMLYFHRDTTFNQHDVEVDKIAEHKTGLAVPNSIWELKGALGYPCLGRQVYLHSHFVRATMRGLNQQATPTPAVTTKRVKSSPAAAAAGGVKKKITKNPKNTTPSSSDAGNGPPSSEDDGDCPKISYGGEAVRTLHTSRWPPIRAYNEFRLSPKSFAMYNHWKENASRHGKPAQEARKRLTAKPSNSYDDVAKIALNFVKTTKGVTGELAEEVALLLLADLDGSMRASQGVEGEIFFQ